ncbi:glycosyltransferase [Mucilaginibacter sp.]|uniref:glycosyltransferase n=1 Tax=Mucilaginibacter sp. TaxID=1882438 RepID=UPI0026394B0F|nr:glycosyltransferase [Mucilaginibacter sp.]MDB4926976.1 hypothetical protein [Mucilaginibacter sp.]
MLPDKKKVALISSGQPSLNPRLVKEADALSDANYEVTVLYAYWNAWGTEFDKQLISSKKWKAICIGGDPQYKQGTYFISRFIYKFAQIVSSKTKGKFMADWTIARASYFLMTEAKKHIADLYIAHNLGALPAVVAAAKVNNKSCGFDAEDFHRHETSDDSNNEDVILKTSVENKYIPQLNYFSTSSKQIANAYQQIFPNLRPVILLNVFPNSHLSITEKHVGYPLKLFWFSQTIGPDRGINDIVDALQLLNKTDFELHLLGNQSPANKSFIDKINNSDISIQFHDPVHPDKLIEFAAQFDIGLALEPGFSINNNIALSNKLFTYMQAGLAIIASNTTAQQDFMNQNPQIGSLYPKKNSEILANILLSYYQDKDKLISCKAEALRLAHQQYNWEVERLKFLKAVKKALQDSNK